MHLNKRLLTAALQLMIQYPELLSSFKVAPLSLWAHLMWHCCMIRVDTFSPFGKMIGCLFSYSEMIFSVNLQHILSHYTLFKNASNCLIVELLGIATSLFLLLNSLSSAENLFPWTNLINWTSLFWGRSLPFNGYLIASIFIFLRRIYLNLNTQDMTLFILFCVDIFSSSWWSMSKDTSV